jgi:hypothetical protein
VEEGSAVSTWRDSARPIIAKVLRETKGQDEKVIKKALRDAYPWGQRAMHPYKIWLDEIRRQRGLKTTGPRKGKLLDVPPDPRQEELFDE